MAATPDDSPHKAAYLNTLSNKYNSRFNRLGKLEDLERAIRAIEKAIAATPDNSPERSRSLYNMSNHYSSRFFSIGELEDLEKAINVAEQTITDTPDDCPDFARNLSNLSNHYSSRFRRLGKLEDLEKAIHIADQAIVATPGNSPDLSKYLNNLSNCYIMRFDEFKKLEDLERAITHMEKAFSISCVSPLSRVGRGERLSKLRAYQGDHAGAAHAAAHAVLLLPRVSPRYLARRDQEYTLSQVNGLSSLACSLALQAGKPADEAFGLVEIGRAVMASLATDLQSDVLILRDYHPHLYKRYEDLRYRLSAEPSDEKNMFSEFKIPKADWDDPFRIERDLTQVEDQIREMPGFSNFQLPPDVEELKEMAKEGPLVAFNVTDVRGDALIITDTGIKALALGTLNYSEAKIAISSINQLSNRHPQKLAKNNEQMKRLLGWLWLTAVKPVLEELGFLEQTPLQGSELPRIWWITNGIMGSAPLHAAGIYDGVHGEDFTKSAMDFVVSCYISTAKALRFARDRLQWSNDDAQGEPNVDAHGKALLISAPEEDLDFEGEIGAIKEVIEKHHRTVSVSDGSRKKILHHIKHSSIVHFACHGVSVGFDPSSEPPKSPSDSYLLLKGSLEIPDEKLTVDDLAKVRHLRAWLAFLSACSTAKNSAESLTDEMIHIANAFQLAGYPHVVGTLWETDDECAKAVSKAFYENLLGGDGSGNTRRSVAAALHEAIRELRRNREFKKDYIAWAPFVYIGA
ncbi:hypothetical protein ABW20_dc0101999 [Dactylellina cionopaga]|nr:hypothetical protein ABW20_dc0101999 [Dactylellina cionopaga]